MAVKQSKAAVLIKKKVWLPIIAPALFNNQTIGEIYVEEPQQAIGRRITVSLMVLTGDPQRQSIHISFDITKAENHQLHTQVVGYSIIPVAVRKMMRRGKNRIDDSFVAKTQDGIALRIKPTLITRSKATGTVLTDVRKHLRANIVRALSKTKFIDFIHDLVAHKYQRELQDSLRKIHPLQICELRDVHIEKSEKGLKSIITAAALPAEQKAQPAEQPAEAAPAQDEQPAQA